MLYDGFALSRIRCFGAFRDSTCLIIFATGRTLELITDRGRAGRSADAIVVDVRGSKHFSKSRLFFALHGPFDKHVFQRLPSDRLG